MDYSPFERQEIISSFLQDKNMCSKKLGAKIKNCEELRANFEKEMGSSSGCSSCKKKAVYSKYRQIISAQLLQEGR